MNTTRHTPHPVDDAVAPDTDAALSLTGVGRSFRDVHALTDVSFSFERDGIHGLLGRNGAGKTTLLGILSGLDRADSGTVRVLGADPFENTALLQQVCFVREGQCYPDDMRVHQVLTAAAALLPYWDAGFADRLLSEYDLPPRRRVKRLSRGMRSALGIVIGLASRAPVTLFDEPYLGLDAVARQMFYDALLADFAEHPRTIVLSTHLIDEVAGLLDHIVVLDHGRVAADTTADELRTQGVELSGPTADVDRACADARVLRRESMGPVTRALALFDHTPDVPDRVSIAPAPLQDIVVGLHTSLTHTTLRQEVAS